MSRTGTSPLRPKRTAGSVRPTGWPERNGNQPGSPNGVSPRTPPGPPSAEQDLRGLLDRGGRTAGGSAQLDDLGDEFVVGRLAWWRMVIFEADPHVAAPLDRQGGDPAGHHVAAEHRRHPGE